jgi:MFS family permease
MVVGWVLDHLQFPVNYQAVFIGLSVGGLISYYFSSHIVLPDVPPRPSTAGQSLRQRITEYVGLVRGERAFLSFTAKQIVYNTGLTLAVPLFPIYLVRTIHTTDAWIGAINSVQTAVVLIGYFFWARQGRVRGSRFVLLWTTLGLALYPALAAATGQVELIAALAGLAGIFQAGINLVFFDELMKTVPVEHSATFVSVSQSLQYFSAMVAPLIGTTLADHAGIHVALVASTVVRLAGFGLFMRSKPIEVA